MLFSREHVTLIRRGMKTQTRRLKRPRVVVGRSYPIQTRLFRRQRLGRIRVLALYRERLAGLSTSDARREGYRTRKAYFAVLAALNGKIDRRRSVWVVCFRKSR